MTSKRHAAGDDGSLVPLDPLTEFCEAVDAYDATNRRVMDALSQLRSDDAEARLTFERVGGAFAGHSGAAWGVLRVLKVELVKARGN